MTLETRSRHLSRAALAGLAALVIAAFLFAQDLIGVASSTLIGFTLDDVASGYFGNMWQGLVGFGLLTLLLFAGGVFLSLWVIAPILSTLTLKQALLRGLLAAAVGAALVLLFSLAMNLIGPFSGAGPLLGNAFPWPSSAGTIQAFTMSLQTGIGALVRQAPVVMLVVVVAWLWLQKHPSSTSVSTDTGEV